MMWPVFDCIMLTGTCIKYKCLDILYSWKKGKCHLFSFKEMIIDKVNGQVVPRYLIYDIIKFNVSTFIFIAFIISYWFSFLF